MKTQFEKIAHFNTLIGNTNSSSLEGLKAQWACMVEEFEETAEAFKVYIRAVERCELHGNDGADVYEAEEAFKEIRDGLCDILVTTFGFAHRAGIDADKDLDAVYESNMSKFLNDENHVEGAMEITLRLGVATIEMETAPGIWAVTSAYDQHGKDGKFYPKGKLLKPSTFKEPVFDN